MSCFDLWDMCSLNHTYNEQFYMFIMMYHDINYDDI